MPLRFLSREDLERLGITTADVVAAIERLLLRAGESRAWNAPKAVARPADGRYMMATLAAADDPPFMAVKALLLNPANTERGLPAINSLVTLLDGRTGEPLAVMDGNWITAVRTAGLSAVAAKRLARPSSTIAAFIGCGVQARSHLDALRSMFPLKEIRALGRGSANRDALLEAARGMGLAASAAGSAREAVAGADLVVSTVTISARPVPFLDARWLAPGAFATITDLGGPWLPDGMAAFDRIVIDDREQEAAMADPMVPLNLVSGDLAGLMTGAIAGRRTDNERTAFIFRGLGLGDLALAALAYERAGRA